MSRWIAAYVRRHHLALLALFVALGGTSIAATNALLPRNSVGTAQVINGSLQAGDLSKKAKKTLKGLRGARGVSGTQGAQGPQGAQGAPAAQTLVVRYGPVVTAPVGSSPDAIAPCASGERVFGGGFAIAGGVSFDFLVLRSIPNAVDTATNPTSWLVEFANRDYNDDGLGDVGGRAVAICGSS
jgi:hypothetical protein